MRRSGWTFVPIFFLIACGGDDKETTAPPAVSASAARGEYIVEHLGPCAQCHSPKDPMGMPIEAQRLSGSDCFIDITPMDDTSGCIATPNLTNDETGLKNRTDAEIKEMITNGKRPDGTALFPIMPYFVIHAYTDVDVDSIIMYLRTVPGVKRAVAASQAPFDAPLPAPEAPLGEDEMPMPLTVNEATMRGRYLGVTSCMLCHTPLTDPMNFRSLNKAKLFAGGGAAGTLELGLPSPPLPAVIESTNLTPDPKTGSTYSKDELISLLKSGKDKGGTAICPPMPIGNAYGGMTDADLSDLADYLLALPPIENAVASSCVGL